MKSAFITLFVNLLPFISENPIKFTFTVVVRKFVVSFNESLTAYLIISCCISSFFLSLISLVFPF